jgi:hypothetical protein
MPDNRHILHVGELNPGAALVSPRPQPPRGGDRPRDVAPAGPRLQPPRVGARPRVRRWHARGPGFRAVELDPGRRHRRAGGPSLRAEECGTGVLAGHGLGLRFGELDTGGCAGDLTVPTSVRGSFTQGWCRHQRACGPGSQAREALDRGKRRRGSLDPVLQGQRSPVCCSVLDTKSQIHNV